MKYVLDSSVALKWVLPEPDSGRALLLRDEYNASIHDLIAPDIFIPEIANGLAVRARCGHWSEAFSAPSRSDGRGLPNVPAS